MSHDATVVSRMEDPSNWLGEGVTGIDDTINEPKFDVAGFFPILDGKVLDVDVARSFSCMAGINNLDGRCIIFIQDSWASRGETQTGENGAEILRRFGCQYGSDELCLGRTGGSDSLRFGAVCDSCTSKDKDVSSRRLAGAEVVGI